MQCQVCLLLITRLPGNRARRVSTSKPGTCDTTLSCQIRSPILLGPLGRWSLAALMVNIIIGGGIFELPASVAGILGAQSPVASLVAAAGVGVIAACIAEVASRFQHSGGPYLYARVAFGRFLGLTDGMASVDSGTTVCPGLASMTSTRHFCQWAVHSFAGVSCERRGRRAERPVRVLLGPRSEQVRQVASSH